MTHKILNFSEQESPETELFFKEVSDEDKKNIQTLHLKLKTTLAEKHKLIGKCTGLES